MQIVRETMAGRKDKESAAAEAVKKCLQEGILTDFLKIYGSEAVNMAFTEFNYEEYIEQIKKDYYEEGKAESILEILDALGEIPESLRKTIYEQQNLEVLKNWLRLAAKVNTIEEFNLKMF